MMLSIKRIMLVRIMIEDDDCDHIKLKEMSPYIWFRETILPRRRVVGLPTSAVYELVSRSRTARNMAHRVVVDSL